MNRTGRRTVLAAAAALIAAPPGALRGALLAEKSIAEITHSVIFPGRQTGVSWFHPRPCRLPGGRVLMTLQTISGSDYFGPVHWTSTSDGGKSWSEPQPIAALGRLPIPGGVEEGVCDVVPDYHGPTKSVLAIGHTVNYRGGRFYAEQPARWPVYAVRSRTR